MLLFFIALVRVQAALAADGDLRERGLVALEQRLLDIGTIGRVMNIAAHPDDEDGATLAYCRHRLGVRTMTVFANRGEGGQNEIGAELYRDLGAIREVETRRAADWLGNHPYFLGLEDFGFCKTAEEAFLRWGGQAHVTERMVFALRSLRPDVVFSNHDPLTGHGQHRALSIAARAAFHCAGDPDAYPEQGLDPWEPVIYLERTSATEPRDERGRALDRSAIFTLDVEATDELRGTTFHEQARRALQEHRSQGRWEQLGRGQRGFRVVYRRCADLLADTTSPFDADLLTGLRIRRAAAGGAIDADEAARLLDRTLFAPRWPATADREALASVLIDQRSRVARALADRHTTSAWRTALRDDLAEVVARINDALGIALGVSADLVVEPAAPVAGGTATLTLRVEPGPFASAAAHSHPGEEHDAEHADHLGVPQPAVVLGADFAVPLAASPLYDQFDPARRLAVTATYTLRHDRTGRAFAVSVDETLPVRPPVIVDFAPRRRVLRVRRDRHDPLEVQAIVRVDLAEASTEPIAFALHPAGDAEPVWSEVLAASPAGEHWLPMRFPCTDVSGSRVYQLRSAASARVTAVADFRVVVIDAEIAGDLQVGVVRSYDDTLENALVDLGVATRRLSADDLAFRDLQYLDAILVDIRAYLVRDDLVRFNRRLLDYAAAGGTLGVFYQKTGEWNAASNGGHAFAPYRLEVTRDRVVDEAAPVTLLLPGHPLLAAPNRIDIADFAGWIHERGLYFPEASYGPEYEELLSCHDIGEPAKNGGLLVARYGRGFHVYTAYGWYRQWLAGVPGAYRFLANLVSLSRTAGVRAAMPR